MNAAVSRHPAGDAMTTATTSRRSDKDPRAAARQRLLKTSAALLFSVAMVVIGSLL